MVKSPCLSCDIKGDKNGPECLNCEKRREYVRVIGGFPDVKEITIPAPTKEVEKQEASEYDKYIKKPKKMAAKYAAELLDAIKAIGEANFRPMVYQAAKMLADGLLEYDELIRRRPEEKAVVNG